jgi:membrane-associated protein
VVSGRFVPIVRTFVPFVAGAASMTASTFVFYNVIGGIIWVVVCAGAGYLFGNVPIIKDNFSLVAIGIVLVSVLPIAIEFLRQRNRGSSPST